MTTQEYYQALNDNYVHWDRRDEDHIVVWTSGYRTAECYEIERFLMKGKFFALSMDFDSLCGKTKTVYKCPK